MSDKISRRNLLKLLGASAAAGVTGQFSSAIPNFDRSQANLEHAALQACVQDWTPTLAPFEKYDPIVQIAVPYNVNDNVKMPGKDLMHHEMANWWRDHLGIEFSMHWQAPNGDLRNNRLQTDLAAGTLPDFFLVDNQDLINKFVESGAVEDITDIFEKNASELLKKETSYPNGDIWANVKRGKRVFGIAWTGAAYNSDTQTWVRKDWLKKLNLPEPKTLDEFTETMRAFKKSGTSQYGLGASSDISGQVLSLNPVFGSYGVMPSIWRDNPDGTLRYGSLDPAVKDALNLIRGWYAEGLLDADFYTMKPNEAVAGGVNGRWGICFGPHWMNSQIREPHHKLNKEYDLDTVASPKGPDGKQGRKGHTVRGNAAFFRKGLDPHKIEAMVKFTNWMAEMADKLEIYKQYTFMWMAAFTKDYCWVFDKDCNVITGPQHAGLVHTLYWDMAYVGWFPRMSANSFAKILSWKDVDKSKLNKAQQYLISDPGFLDSTEYYLRGVRTAEIGITDRWLGPNTEEMTRLLPDLKTLEETTFIDIIIGKKPVDAFNDFVKDWKSAGGDTVTQAVNDWKAKQK